MDGWLRKKGAAAYMSLSERSLTSLLKQGLRHSRLPSGTVLISVRSIDEYLEKFEVDISSEVDKIVRDIEKELS